MILPFLIIAVFATGMLTAAISDARTMTIPNWVSLFVFGSFFLIIPFVWQGWGVFGEHLLICLCIFALGFALFAVGGLGGGDAKLLAATAIWWQWPDLTMYLIYTTLAGGVLGLFMIVGKKFMPVRLQTSSWASVMFQNEKNMPYGLALAFGALMTLPQSQIFKAAAGLG